MKNSNWDITKVMTINHVGGCEHLYVKVIKSFDHKTNNYIPESSWTENMYVSNGGNKIPNTLSGNSITDRESYYFCSLPVKVASLRAQLKKV